ncbi:hypothetical protein, partial [Catellatospora sp. NPDC049609]|uniref:hypothetical protein n=1 Tax=Catellatospora sp. NPDC049609 TaxID=3155505 RepID=UPI0034240868
MLVEDASLPVQAGAVGYRAVGDGSSARFEYLAGVSSSPYWWAVHGSGGTVAYFGLRAQHPWSFAPLVRQTRPDGGGDPAELKYTYATVGRTTAAPTGGQPREFLLTGIDYEAPNEGAAQAYARVEFSWADPVFCGNPETMPAVGSRLDYRSGFARLSGTRKLTQVRTLTQNPTGEMMPRSVYALSYHADTERCDGQATPFRQLASVRPTVFRPAVALQEGPAQTVLPATSFTYGKAASYVKDEHYGAALRMDDDLLVPESVDTNALSRLSHPALFAPTGVQTGSAPFSAVPGDGSAQLPVNGDGQLDYTLAWQLSAAQASGESVQRTLVDIDGDRDLDVLRRSGPAFDLSSPANAPATGGCKVDVYLNQSGNFVKQDGSNANASRFPAFSLRKAMGDVPVGASIPDSGVGELLCAGLNRSFSPNGSGGWQGDPNTSCASKAQWGAPASWKSWQQVRHGLVDLDGDGKPELVSQVIGSVHCPYASTQGVPAPGTSLSDDADWQTEFYFSHAADPTVVVTKRQMWWHVYRNTGSGFETTPTRVRAGWDNTAGGATDLVARVPEMGFLGQFAARKNDQQPAKSTLATLRDITGDGYLDLVHDGVGTAGGQVVPGRSGGFAAIGQKITLPGAGSGDLAPRMDKHSDDCNVDFEDFVGYLAGGAAVDVNGDGLPDRVDKIDSEEGDRCQAGGASAEGTKVMFNTGAGFATAADDGEVMFSQNAPDTQDLSSFHVREDGYDWQGYPYDSDRNGRAKMMDLDGDGLADLLFYDRVAGRAQAYGNGGRQWVSTHAADTFVAKALAGQADVRPAGALNPQGGGAAINEWADRGDYRHTMTYHAADLNGDGLLDLIEGPDGDGTTSVRYAKPVIGSGDTAAPARLLRTVTNGTGAKTTVSYTRDVAAGKWVATTVTADPGHGQPAVTSDYRYMKPAFVAGPYGRKAFRGYEETHTVLNTYTPGTADNVTYVTRRGSYAYAPGGLVEMSATVMGQDVDSVTGIPDGQVGVMSLAEYTYQLRPLGLLPPAVRANYPTYVPLPEKTTSYTCTGTGGQTLAACRTSGAKVTSETDWTERQADGEFVMFLPSVSETRFVNGEGNSEVRRSTPTFNLVWNADTFRVAPATSTDTAVVDGAESTLGQVRYTYDDLLLSRVKTVTVDDADPDVADRTTRFAYYGGSGTNRGLLHKVWEPEQYAEHADFDPATSGGFTEYGYDTNGVHVTTVTNPLGHTVHLGRVDPATGQPLEPVGPNYACPDGTDPGTALDPATACTFEQAKNAGLAERSRIHVDGLGRVVRAVVFPIGDVEQERGVETFRATYNDLAYEQSQAKVSVVTESLVGDGTGGQQQFSRTTVDLDGMGRT